ncbi:MAG TPA: CHAT domain-containing protein [Blastocatellia bacterium]|nr:CHAT domain-containing protein [Blastocatellia bacterium]
MSKEADSGRTIRRYLLSDVAEAERQQVEERLMIDDEYETEILLAEDDLVDEYVSGEMPRRDREKFEAVYLSTQQGRDQVEFTAALKRYAATAKQARGHRESRFPLASWLVLPLRAAALALLMIAVAFGVWRVFFYESALEKGLVALRRAYPERPTEGRISDFPYAPVSATRGAGPATVDTQSRNRAEILLGDAYEEERSAATLHALGQLHLAKHELDQAIEQLTAALQADPQNARIHSDLGAAYLEEGKSERASEVSSEGSETSGKSLEYFGRSLEHLNKALELDGSLLEALFNRALCHQYLLLPRQAREDWQLYLQKDPNSRWADEARRNLAAVEEQQKKSSQNKEELYREFLSAFELRDDDRAWRALTGSYAGGWNRVSEALVDEFLAQAAEASRKTDARPLRALSYAGELELKQSGDRFTVDLARFLGSASAPALRQVARARKRMKSGNQLVGSRSKEALEAYDEASRLFERAGDFCEAQCADYRIGVSHLYRPDPQTAVSLFGPLRGPSQKLQHRRLLGQVLFSTAQGYLDSGQFSTGIEFSKQALDLAVRLDDRTGQVRTCAQLAGAYEAAGDAARSLHFIRRGLMVANESGVEPSQVSLICGIASDAFLLHGLYAAAIDYQKEALRLAEEAGDPALVLSRHYTHLGMMRAKAGDFDRAFSDVEHAYEIGKSLSADPTGRSIMSFALLRLGHLHRLKGDFDKAISAYDQSIEIARNVEVHTEGYAAHKGKLLCYVAKRDVVAAAAELQTAIAMFEQYRSKILEESDRDTFFDSEQDIYDLAIDFEYSMRGDREKAFEYSDASHARSLLDMTEGGAEVIADGSGSDLMLGSTAKPAPWEALVGRMPENVQVLQYAVLDSKIIAWVVTKADGIRSAEKTVSRDELNARVDGHLKRISRPPTTDDADASQSARELYGLLVSPVEPLLDRQKVLCVVPDEALNFLPFAALVSPASGRYLISDYVVMSAPSTAMLLKCTDKAREKEGQGTEKLLSVGDPDFDRAAHPDLPRLASARAEANRVAGFYSGPTVLIGERAREKTVMAEIVKADVVNLATHYVVDPRSPMRSMLVLAKEPGRSEREESDGGLRASEVYRLKLPRTRLVVLSACQTGIERSYSGEGAIGIARPFIKAGVPLVVASLWPVDSEATAELIVKFHERRARGLSSVEALTQAQRELIENSNGRFREPYYWSAFSAIGGLASF